MRRGIYYEFSRRNIEIPFPIQTEIAREEVRDEPEKRVDRYSQIIGGVPVLAALAGEGRRALAQGAAERLFGDGEVIVHEGDPGESMFIVCRGQVTVTIANGREVARTSKGGYFGEMSLLTGEPRSATVTALGDCTVLEISADTFKEYVTAHPEVIEHLASSSGGATPRARSVPRRSRCDVGRNAALAGRPDAQVLRAGFDF